MMLSLFALVDANAEESRVRRFALSAAVQGELTAALEKQVDAFNASIADEIAFDGKYKPDEGEVLCIENIAGLEDLEEAVANPMGCAEIDATQEEFERIKGLFSGWLEADRTTLIFQNFDRRRVISTNGLSIFHAANVYRKIEGIGLTIDSKLSAMYREGRLRFRSFHGARQLIDLSAYYIEATDIDIVEFAAQDLINAADVEALVAMADTWTRRKVALIQKSQILTRVPLNEIRAVALEFGIQIGISMKGDVEAINVPASKAELKELLRFLDEDYYKSALSKTNFLTNSKRAV